MYSVRSLYIVCMYFVRSLYMVCIYSVRSLQVPNTFLHMCIINECLVLDAIFIEYLFQISCKIAYTIITILLPTV